MKSHLKFALLAALLVLLTFGVTLTVVSCTCGKKEAKDLKPTPEVVEGVAGPQISGATGYSDVAERAVKSVVNISSTKVIRGQGQENPLFNDPIFRRFFGNPNFGGPRERRERALGSGVIVSKDGYILTNNHMVSDATKVLVQFYDGRETEAKVVGTDDKTDLAVIKVEEKNLDPLPLGDSDQLRLGEVVLAIGNPFGLGNTVTMGIVSAKGRTNMDVLDYEDFIQTDAAINMGNSGGALVNTRGQLVGINTMIFSRSGGSEGVGFAIPINLARSVMNDLVRYGEVRRGYVGIFVQDVNVGLAEHFGLDKPTGALVSEVAPNSPAAEAGLQRGDIILELNGKEIPNSTQLRNLVAQLEIGGEAGLVVLRNKQRIELKIKVIRRPADANVRGPSPRNEPPANSNTRLGLDVTELSPFIIQRFQLPPDLKGVIVSGVAEGSPAADAGLAPRDIITEVNGRAVSTGNEFAQAIKSAGRHAVLLVYRGGNTIYVDLPLGD